jgi:hypothetical protein
MMLQLKSCAGALLSMSLMLAAGAHAAEWKAFSTEGGQAPAPLVLPDLSGREVDLASFKGEVVLEENGGLPLSDAKVEAARRRLFGSWEMNWLAYNYAHDVRLPGAARGPVGFFMYPNAEVAGQGKVSRIDSLDPENFRYTITSREILV